MNAVSNEKRCPTSMAFQHQADWYTNFPRFQGAQLDHVRVQSSRCCFPRASLSFVRPSASLSFDQWHVTRSPLIRKRIWVGRYNNQYYYSLNSLTLFWLGESVQWIFEISARDVITAYYTIIMSTTLKVTDNHVMCDHGAWFLRVIISSLRALCCLPSVRKKKHDFNFFFVQCIRKQLLDSVFVISSIIKVSVRVISLSLRLRLITLNSTLIILDITKTSSNNCLKLASFIVSYASKELDFPK